LLKWRANHSELQNYRSPGIMFQLEGPTVGFLRRCWDLLPSHKYRTVKQKS